MDKLYYNYDDITKLIEKNISKITDYNPEIVIAIGGGGLIPSRIIRNYINKPIYVVTVSLYNDTLKKEEVNVLQWITLNLKDKKVLIIDEIDDTRQTLGFCVDRLKTQNNAKNIGIFVLQNKIKSKSCEFDDDIHYMSCENIDDRWVVYPWDN